MVIREVMPSKYKSMLMGASLKVDLHTSAVVEAVLTFMLTFALLWIIVKGPRNLVTKPLMIATTTVSMVVIGRTYTGPSHNPINIFVNYELKIDIGNEEVVLLHLRSKARNRDQNLSRWFPHLFSIEHINPVSQEVINSCLDCFLLGCDLFHCSGSVSPSSSPKSGQHLHLGHLHLLLPWAGAAATYGGLQSVYDSSKYTNSTGYGNAKGSVGSDPPKGQTALASASANYDATIKPQAPTSAANAAATAPYGSTPQTASPYGLG